MPTPPAPVPAAAESGQAGSGLPVRPAARYGDRTGRGRQRAVRGALGTVAALAVGGWLVVAYDHADVPVRGQLSGYDDITDTSIEVQWTVFRPPNTPVVCTIRARDLSGSEVGRTQVELAAGPASSVDLSYRLITLARPYNADLLDCREAT